MSTAAAVLLLLAVAFYAIFGGADFGAGFWDLTAGGPERGRRPREVIDHSIGPVWEANHVWLIFVFVVLWTCFPEAYASITLTLFVPLTIAALGIVLRGRQFRLPQSGVPGPRPAPLRRHLRHLLGPGALLLRRRRGRHRLRTGPGRRPSRRPVDELGEPDLGPRRSCWPFASTAYVAAVLLTWDAGRLSDETLVAYFRSRAVGAAVVAGVVAVVGLFVLRGDARYVFDGLTSRALPLVVLSALAGARRVPATAWQTASRSAASPRSVASGALVLAWGVAQWDYLLPETLTVSQAAAPTGTITAVLLVAALAVLFIAPAFALLYTLDQKSLLPDEGVHDGPQQPTDLG